MRSPLRLTVSRLGFALLITSLSLIQLLWVLYHKNDGGQGRIDTSKQSYKATAKITINPNPPPIPNDSFPQVRLSEERLTSIHRNSTLPSPSQIPTTHPLLSTSKPSSTQPYILPLHPLANPKFTLPYEVSQPSSRWECFFLLNFFILIYFSTHDFSIVVNVCHSPPSIE